MIKPHCQRRSPITATLVKKIYIDNVDKDNKTNPEYKLLSITGNTFLEIFLIFNKETQSKVINDNNETTLNPPDSDPLRA